MAHSYAQTIIQLYNQLRLNGYSDADMVLVRNAYELAMLLFSGRFQPSGKTLISHGVGTASILTSLRLPGEVVAAGLIHNAYQNGDFGDGKRFISKTKRKYVRQAVGKEVEEYVARFATLKWKPENISTIRDEVNELNPVDRNTVLIRLADHLEHLLDLDALYYKDIGRKRYTTDTHILGEVAESLGFPNLADEIRESYKETKLAKIPVEFTPEHSESFVIPPLSYRKRLSVLLLERFYHLGSVLKLRGMTRSLASVWKEKNKV